MARENMSTVYTLLGLIIVLLLISLGMQLTDRGSPTSWATIKSRELHTFFGDCRSAGGTVDVRPNSAPSIVFLCGFADRTVEYTLDAGK